mgnify:CR=1 FL=1
MKFKYPLIALLMACAGSAWSQEFIIDGINYRVSSQQEKTCSVLTADDEISGDVVIPSTVTYGGESYTVTKLEDYAFAYSYYLTSIEIPSTVTVIGKNVFDSCLAMESAKLPETLTTLDDYAFFGCAALKDVNFPQSVTTVGLGPFGACDNLKEPIYNDEVFAMLPTSYEGKYEIPDGIKTVAGYACYNCMGLTEVVLPNSVTTVGNYAFYYCDNLTEPVFNDKIFAALPIKYSGAYTIPDGITTVAGGACVSCLDLTSVVIPSSVTTICTDGFSYCTSLKDIELPNSVTYIGDYAFSGLNVLAKPLYNDKIFAALPPWHVGEYTIPDGITTIAGGAFEFCTTLTSIDMPESVDVIGKAAFIGCAAMSRVKMPASMSKLGAGTFSMCHSIESLVIPSGIETIEQNTCYQCYSLGSLEIPSSVTSIGYVAFQSCYNLESVVIPNSVTSIGDYAFYDCMYLSTVDLGSSLESIGMSAFDACTEIMEIKSRNIVPPTLDPSTFNGVDKSACTVKVLDIALDDYKADAQWAEFLNLEGVKDFDGIQSVQVSDIKINADHGYITVTGARRGERIAVYALDGSLITTAVAADSQTVVPCPASGLVIVKCGTKAVKCPM